MNIISNYNEYIVELKLIEALKTFPLFLSKRLRDILSQIDHEIAKELLSKHSDLESRVKQTFIDIHETKADAITFIQPNKAVQVLGFDITDDIELPDALKKHNDVLKVIDDNNNVYKTYRSETRWGRFINNTFPNKYILSKGGGQNKEDIESFVNMYKSLYNQDDNFKLLDIVKGYDIAYWYDCDNYSDNDDGTLGDSCMKSMDTSTFELYTSNPDVIRLLIMYSDDEKRYIQARALLWNLSEPSGRVFMDRVYTNDHSDEQTFIDYAKKKNWLYKSRQSMGSDVNITDPITDNSSSKKLMAEVNNIEYDQYPYLDTMTFYNPNSGKISNRKSYNAKYELTDTNGDRYNVNEYDSEPEYVYSNYHNSDIDKNEAKYCIFGDDWVNEDVAIRVWNSSEWGHGENYAVPGHPDVVESKFSIPGGNLYNRHFPKSKCIWSDYLSTWLFNNGRTSGAKRVWTDLDRSKYVIDHIKRLNKTFYEIDGEYWIDELVENGELIGTPTPKISRPVNAPSGWHRKIEFIDDDGNIFNKGKYVGKVK